MGRIGPGHSRVAGSLRGCLSKKTKGKKTVARTNLVLLVSPQVTQRWPEVNPAGHIKLSIRTPRLCALGLFSLYITGLWDNLPNTCTIYNMQITVCRAGLLDTGLITVIRHSVPHARSLSFGARVPVKFPISVKLNNGKNKHHLTPATTILYTPPQQW